ncbi:small lysine-rich protein 1 [Ostrinia furnacalis]|uniref:small lysine-rich protein 1 n=1 Tax=Ostrinia furnacalis TaxID=93504 RepID=UPI00103CA3AC|nr:small lysine-rich protein 1 [Ostrinia furnacalis]
MPGKGKGKKKEKKEEGGDEKKAKKGGRGKKGKSKGRCNVDMLTEAAMDNVYYACHNVQELLAARGFHPPDFTKKKKKGKR